MMYVSANKMAVFLNLHRYSVGALAGHHCLNGGKCDVNGRGFITCPQSSTLLRLVSLF
jgi:hypothetical protein